MRKRLLTDVAPQWGYRPVLYDLANPAQRETLASLLADRGDILCSNTIHAQLRDLARTHMPSAKIDEEELDRWIIAKLAGRSLEEYGVAVYYPWLRRVVHILPRAEFEAVRSTRNRYKITDAEHQQLVSRRIGIVGLSAGYWAATTMALEGIGGEFRLADFDRISLANTNRLPCGVGALEVNKAVQTARQMFEVSPYLTIETFESGLEIENQAAFFTAGGQLDLVVEECDELATKVQVREIARRLGIPVVMETNDRGMLDVERFDLDPQRPIFHGLVGDLDTTTLDGLSTKEKLPFVLALLGGDGISERAAASMLEIDESISGWPQLASDTTLGGALVAATARRILLGQFEDSGRYYVDLDQIIAGSTTLATASEPAPQQPGEVHHPPHTGAETRANSGPDLSVDEVRTVVASAIAAPSGGNCQPWRFVWRAGALDCIHEVERSASFLDYRHLATYLAFGAALENLVMASAGLGLRANLDYFPQPRDPTLVCRVELRRDHAAVAPDLLKFVFARATNRQLGERKPVSAGDLAALTAAVDDPGVGLQLLTGAGELGELGAILGEIDRFRFFSKQMHREFVAELRWNQRQVEDSRDGIDVATLELGAADAAGLRLASSWPVVDLLRRTRRGKSLENISKRAIDAAAAVGQLAVTGTDPLAYLRGGRAMQRLWLTATGRGLAFQPIASAPYLFARLRSGAEGFTATQSDWLGGLRSRYAKLFQVASNRGELLVFRIAHAQPPTVIALRRSVDDVVAFA